jgi:nucleotide-binding universal stress UspA family protein
LTAINGSSHAEAVLCLGAQITRCGREPLTILTVVRHDADQPAAAAETILARAYGVIGHQGPDLCARVRIGHPATEIIREAQRGGYDLVIVGEGANRNPVTRFVQGSTAIRVVEHAPCPVIVAKGKIGPLRRILLCDSGSEDPAVGLAASLGTEGAGSSVLYRFTRDLADLCDGAGKIVVLHVMSQMSAGPGVRGKQLRSDTDALIEEQAPEGQLLGRDVETLSRLGLGARARVRHGLVVEEILEEAQAGDYDLVVIGAHQGQGWQRVLLDDLSHRIVVELDRPVLVVR